MTNTEALWHRIVFSDRSKDRLLRHALFWLAWWSYLSFYKWYEQRPSDFQLYIPSFGEQVMLKTFLILCLQAMACYFTLYVVMPRFLISGSWPRLALEIVFMLTMMYLGGYVLHFQIFPLVDRSYGRPADLTWAIVYNTLLMSPKIIAPAVGIKSFKYWRRKQVEKEVLEKEQAENELKLLTSRLRPEFMLNALDNLFVAARESNLHAQDLLIKFSELLSYIIYECDEAMVPLNREVTMMGDYVYMKTIQLRGDRKFHIPSGDTLSGYSIVPFLLLPIIDQCFLTSHSSPEHDWLDMEIRFENSVLTFSATRGLPEDVAIDNFTQHSDMINLRKRLSILYPGRHQIKTIKEGEMMFISLSLELPANPFQESISTQNDYQEKDQMPAH